MNPLPSFFENAYQPDSNTSAGRLFLTPSDNGRELPIASGPPQSFSSLDEALQAALRPGRQCSVIRGNLFSGGNFDLIDLVLPVCPITPLVARFRPAISNICCLVLDGYAPYFAASISQPGERWVQFPDTREFYLQPDRIKLTQKKEWADGIVKKLDHISLPGVVFSEPAVRRLSAPEMRLLLTNFAQHIFPVKRVDQVTNRGTFKGGGMEQGLTMPVLPSPLHEPECYPTVISNREGRLEAINAYDGGAGISVGAVQFNVQNGELFKFLGKIWEQDRPLFDDAFSGLGWTMSFRQSNGRSIAVLHVTDPRGTTRLLTGIGSGAGGKDESIRYFHCGDPDRAQRKDIDFRTDMTRRFLKLVVWPHIQYLLHDVSLDSLREAMNLVNRMGVPQLDLVRPDRTIFVLRAVLASAYIRASGCASNLMQKLRSYHTAAEKLEHLAEAIEELENIGSFDCAESLRTRLARQRVTAGEVFGQIQQMLGAAHPAAPAAPAPAAPAPARPPAEAQFAPDDMSNWSEGSVWSEWWDGSNAVDPTCDCHAAISNQELAITDAWDEPFGEAVLNLEDAGFSGSTLWAKWQNE